MEAVIGFFGLIILVYCSTYVYYKFLVSYHLQTEGINISSLLLYSDFVLYEDLIIVALTSQELTEIEYQAYCSHKPFPLLGVRLLVNRLPSEQLRGGVKKHTMLIIYPNNPEVFLSNLKLRLTEKTGELSKQAAPESLLTVSRLSIGVSSVVSTVSTPKQ